MSHSSIRTEENIELDNDGDPFVGALQDRIENSTCKLDKSDKFRIKIYKNFRKIQNAGTIKPSEDKTKIELQLEENEKELSNLVWFSDDLVTNIRVRNEKSEFLRKNAETNHDKGLTEKLKAESDSSVKKYEEINNKWADLMLVTEPVNLNEKLEKQKDDIFDVMKSKDNIIDQCQQEINRMSEQYYADQEIQANDVSCLVERIDIQTDLLKDAYNEHLRLLQNAIEEERDVIKNNLSSKWNEFYDSMLKHEESKFEISKKKDQFYAEEVNNIRTKQEELTRATRIRLEKDAEILEWELRIIKNNVLMNSEKLDYNYQVLQKRNEENIIINNQQKRRVAKLNENISQLKRKIQSVTVNTESTMAKLSQNIQKIHSSIKDLEKKSEQFRLNYKMKFQRVWNINYKTVMSLLSKVHGIDRILHEQQLCIKWVKPSLDLENILVDENFPSTKANPKKTCETMPKSEDLNSDNLRVILNNISDRAGFLVEDKLLKLLEPYTDHQKCLIRVDNIFTALRIRNMKTVSSLSDHFKPFSWCPNCTKKDEAFVNFKEICTTGKKVSTITRKSQSQCMDHYFVIEPVLVLTALNNFTSVQFKRFSSQRHFKNENENSSLYVITNDAIIQFWKQLSECMPKKKQSLWAALQHGLNHYLKILKIRLELDEECVTLERQNDELKYLLQKFRI